MLKVHWLEVHFSYFHIILKVGMYIYKYFVALCSLSAPINGNGIVSNRLFEIKTNCSVSGNINIYIAQLYSHLPTSETFGLYCV